MAQSPSRGARRTMAAAREPACSGKGSFTSLDANETYHAWASPEPSATTAVHRAGTLPAYRSVRGAKGRLPELSVLDGSDLCRPDIHVCHGFSAARVLRFGHFSCRATPCSVEGRDALDSCRQAASAFTIAEVNQNRAVVCSRRDKCSIVRLS